MTDNEKIGAAINQAGCQLPDGYMVIIEVELGSAVVCLENPEGDNINFPSNCEGMEQEIRDAIEHAILIEAGES